MEIFRMKETQKEKVTTMENGNEKRENYANEHLVNLHRHQLQSTVKIAKVFHSHSCFIVFPFLKCLFGVTCFLFLLVAFLYFNFTLVFHSHYE